MEKTIDGDGETYMNDSNIVMGETEAEFKIKEAKSEKKSVIRW